MTSTLSAPRKAAKGLFTTVISLALAAVAFLIGLMTTKITAMGVAGLNGEPSNFWVVLGIIWLIASAIFVFQKPLGSGAVLIFAAICAFMPVTVFTLGIATCTAVARLGPRKGEDDEAPGIIGLAIIGALINGVVDTFRSPGRRQVDFLRDLPGTPAEGQALMAQINAENPVMQHIAAIVVPLLFVIGAAIIGSIFRSRREKKSGSNVHRSETRSRSATVSTGAVAPKLGTSLDAKTAAQSRDAAHGRRSASAAKSRPVSSKPSGSSSNGIPAVRLSRDSEASAPPAKSSPKPMPSDFATNELIKKQKAAREAAAREAERAREDARAAQARAAAARESVEEVKRHMAARKAAEAEAEEARREAAEARRLEAEAHELMKLALEEARAAKAASQIKAPPEAKPLSIQPPRPLPPSPTLTPERTGSSTAQSLGRQLIDSDTFRANYGEPTKQVVHRDSIAELVDALVAAPNHTLRNLDAALILKVNKARLNGPLSHIKRYLNFDQYEVISSGDEVRLNLQLLCDHFDVK